jgi:hypothetical protein
MAIDKEGSPITEKTLEIPIEDSERILPTGRIYWEVPTVAEYRAQKKHFDAFGVQLEPRLILASTEEPGVYRLRRNQFIATQLLLATPVYGRDQRPPTYHMLDLNNPEVFPVRARDVPNVPKDPSEYQQRLFIYKNGRQTRDDHFDYHLNWILTRANNILVRRGIEPFPELPGRR